MIIKGKTTTKVVINGVTYTGTNISVVNNKVYKDGSVVGSVEDTVPINVIVHGDVEKIENECGDVQANDVTNISTVSGDVSCKQVLGNVSTVSGDVKAPSIGGNVNTVSGDIN